MTVVARRARAVMSAAAAVVIGVVGPAAGAKPPWTANLVLLVIAGVVPLVAMVLTTGRSWWLRLVVSASVAAIIVARYGKVPGLWLGSSLLLATWVTAGLPPLPGLRRCLRGTTVVVLALALVAVVVGRPAVATWQPLAVLAVAWLVAFASSAARARLPGAGPGAMVGDGRSLPAAACIAVVSSLLRLASVVIAMVSSLVVRPGDGPEGGWTVSDRLAVSPSSPRVHRLGALRLRSWVLPALVIATGLVAAALVLPLDRGGDGPGRRAGTADPGAAVTSQPWYSQYEADLRWLTSDGVAMRPFRPDRIADVATRTITVRDGMRVSWQAPACTCRRIKVWLYGGSGAFGLGQRDEHTVASELARKAAAAGYAVDVENRSEIGELHWRDATRFSWDLTQLVPPDLVVFYDGGEEVEAALELHRRGLGDVLAPYDPMLTDRYDELVGPVVAPDAPLSGGDLVGWPRHPGPEPAPGILAVRRYERSRAMSQRTAEAVGVPARWFWEPDRYEGQPSTATSAAERARRGAFLAAARHLPPGVVDLDESLADAGTSRAIFGGPTLIGEDGARLVAAAMWSHLRGDVERLARGEEVPQ